MWKSSNVITILSAGSEMKDLKMQNSISEFKDIPTIHTCPRIGAIIKQHVIVPTEQKILELRTHNTT